MTGISLSGLASGLDTNTMITQLMQIESQPRTRVAFQQTQVQARMTALKDVQAKLQTLRDASADLRLPATWGNVQTLGVSDKTIAGAKLNGSAGTGDYSVTVVQLARAEQHSFDVAQGVTSGFTVNMAGGGAYNVGAGATAADVAAAINADASAPVNAVLVSPGDGTQRLVLTSKTTGANGGFSTGLTEVAGTARTGRDAQVTVAGDPTVYSSSTNVISGAIPGVDLSLTAPGTTTVTVGAPAPDTDTIVAKVKAYVTAYNDALDNMRSKTTEKAVVNPKTDADKLKGLLGGDSALTGFMNELRQAAYTPFAGLATGRDQLSEIGISTAKSTSSGAINQDALAGKLVFDETAFRASLASDPAGTRALIAGTSTTDGLSQRMTAMLDNDLGDNGIKGRLASGDTELGHIKDNLARMDSRLALTEERYKQQFANLETMLSQAQSQGQWLQGQLAQLQ